MSENQILPETNTSSVDEKWDCFKSKVIKLNYKFIIPNFSFYLTEKKNFFSPNFFADEYNKISWCLSLQLAGDGGNIYLFSNNSIVRAKFKFSIIDDKNTETIWSSAMTTRLFELQNKFVSANNYVSQAQLKKACGDTPSEDKLTILCEIQFIVENVDKIDSLPVSYLSEDLRKLLDNQTFSDVMLIVGEHEFPAHKVLLAARSQVFAAMFEHDMEESRLNRVTITDVNHEVVKELLHFIYTNKAPNLDKMSDDLLAAADKYALEGLKAMCMNFLSTHLSIETAAKTLVLADLHSAKQLKQRAISFIKDNVYKIGKTEDWKDLATHSHLIAELLL